MGMSDEDLLAGVQRRDAAAFSAFYDRHSGRVLGLLSRMLRDRDEAEDVLQNTFWQVWGRAEQYDARRASPIAWLVMLARSRALDVLRRRRPQATAEVEAPDAGGSAATKPEFDELAQMATGALKRLPDEQRSVILLSFYGGLTHEQISQTQQVALGTVKTRIRTGMRRLRELMGESQEAVAS
jgi:RNA polymerase sigma-70 factor (ECF subfamily)